MCWTFFFLIIFSFDNVLCFLFACTFLHSPISWNYEKLRFNFVLIITQYDYIDPRNAFIQYNTVRRSFWFLYAINHWTDVGNVNVVLHLERRRRPNKASENQHTTKRTSERRRSSIWGMLSEILLEIQWSVVFSV